MQMKNVKTNEICKLLKISEDKVDKFVQVIYLLSQIMKYECLVDQYWTQSPYDRQNNSL